MISDLLSVERRALLSVLAYVAVIHAWWRLPERLCVAAAMMATAIVGGPLAIHSLLRVFVAHGLPPVSVGATFYVLTSAAALSGFVIGERARRRAEACGTALPAVRVVTLPRKGT
jgi:hypothetical protein